MGEYMKAQEHFGKAMGIFDEAKQKDGVPVANTNPIQIFGLQFNLGITMMKSNRLDDAFTHLAYARKLLDTKIHEMSSADLEQFGFDKMANRVNVLVNLALVQQKKELFSEALENARSALALVPKNLKIKQLVEKIEN